MRWHTENGKMHVKDKGYAWLILLMSLLSFFVHHGFGSAVIGNLTIVHQKIFNIGLQQSSLIGSIHFGLTLMFGPIGSVLVKRFGCGLTQLFGGTCLILGIGLSSLSSESWHAFLLFSVLAGFGVTCCYASGSEIISQYFDRFKYLAFSVASIGSYVGNSVWPVASQYLLDRYGYSKAMGIMSAAHILHIVAAIAYMRPDELCTHLPERDRSTSELSVKQISENSDTEQVDVSNDVELENDKLLGKVISKDSENEGQDTCQVNVSEGKANTPDVEIDVKIEKKEAGYTLQQSFTILLKDPKVWVLLLNSFLWNPTITVFYILINDYIYKRTELTVDEVALGITILGISMAAGCLLIIFTSTIQFDRMILHVTSVIIYSSATIAISFSNGKMMYYAVAVVWGIGEGMTVTNLLPMIVTFCGPELLTVLFGLVLFAAGIGSLTLTPVCSYISVRMDAQYGLISAGCLGILGSLLLLPIIVINHRQRKQAK